MAHIPVCLVLFSLASASAPAQEKRTDVPLLTVMGSGEVNGKPDEATVRLGVVAEAPTAGEAQAQANSSTQKLLDGIQKLKIDKKDVQTSRLTLTPVYRSPRPGEQATIVAYQANNVLSVRLEDFSLVGRVIDAGLAAGANTVEGVHFSLRDDTEARLRALRDAVTDARMKAVAIAEALGVGLVSVYEVQEGGVQVVPRMLRGGGAMEFAAGTPIEPGQIEVNASVTIRYVITPKR